MEEEDHTQENKNLTEEQIIQLGEIAGVKKGQTYCNMNNVFTNFVYFLSVLLGRPTEARTMNFDCFQRVFQELPANSFDRLNKVMQGIDAMMDGAKADRQAKAVAERKMYDAEGKLSKMRRQANRERAMTDILRFALLEKMDLDEEFFDVE